MANNKFTQFQPKPPSKKMVRSQVHLRPDQVAAMGTANKSEIMRAALDMYLSIHPPASMTVKEFDEAIGMMTNDESED